MYLARNTTINYMSHSPLSHLDHFLHDHMNVEVVVGTIGSKQYVVDYFTWAFLYCILMQNASLYNLHDGSHKHLPGHLYELVGSTFPDLE